MLPEAAGIAPAPPSVPPLPPVLGSCRRGRFGSKHFSVFVARVPQAAKDAFQAPNLNAREHSDYHWFKFAELGGLAAAGKLHPVVKKLLAHHKAEVLAAAGL